MYLSIIIAQLFHCCCAVEPQNLLRRLQLRLPEQSTALVLPELHYQPLQDEFTLILLQ